MGQVIMTISLGLFFRLLAHAPEELQRQAKEIARRAIPALSFTEDDILETLLQEELWETLSEGEQREAVGSLLDAPEYEPVKSAANKAIAEAVARYLHEALLLKETTDGSNSSSESVANELPDPPDWPNL
jgi:hypothetical protein